MRSATSTALRRPRTVLGIWALATAILVVLGLSVEGRLTQSILVVPGTESSEAIELARDEFGESVTVPILLEGPAEEIERQGPALVAELRRRSDLRVLSPWDRTPGAAELRPEKNAAMVVAAIDRPFREAFDDIAPELRTDIDRSIEAPLEARVTGMAAIGNGLKEESYSAAQRAELIAIPILLIVLLAVFRSPIAAAIPAIAGLSTVGASAGLIWILASIVEVDPIAISLASMMGLALGVDYSLLMVSRFREELLAGADPSRAVRRAGATAGRTVIFAGAALILAMLVCLVLSPGDLLLSAGIGVISATILSVVTGLLAMPAALVMVGANIDRWRLGGAQGARSRWVGMIERLLRRPGIATAILVAALALLAAPALGLETGPPDVRQLPEDTPAREDFEAVKDVMGPGWAAPFDVIVSSPEGSVTDPKRLQTIQRFERRVSRWPGVSYVVGPGRLARETKDVERVDRQLARGERGLERLAEGLGMASEGVSDLRGGLMQAADASEKISTGAGTAAERTSQLEATLADGASGSSRLASALERAEAGAQRLRSGLGRARKGARSLGVGVRRASSEVRSELAPAVQRLARGLERGADDIRLLVEPATIAERQALRAFRALEGMTLGRADPRYREAIEAAGRAYGAASGRDPLLGTQLDPRYDGLADEIATGGDKLERAASGADRLSGGVDRLAAGLDRLESGARRLIDGLTRLERGSKKLASGLGRLSEASSRFGNQIEELQPGAGQLVDGLQRLDVGAGRLSSGLSDGYRRSGELESGVERLRGGAAQIYSKTEAGRDRQRRLSPGIFDSGYLVLAALDGASREERDQAEFAVNVESGGEAGAITVVPTTGPNEPETAALRERLSDSAEELGERTQTTTAVGGPAAQLAEYDEVTSSRLVLLILALALVTFLVLVPIFRSLVLPAIAVILNLVTVGAAFGVLALVFEGSSPLLGGPGFVDAVAISAIYTVIFGLTIDYEVFLITRMREGWIETGETNQAISYGLERTAGVVTGAAAIMIGVFVAFAFTEVANTRQFGVGLAVAVLLDATVVRLVLLPAMMRLAGDRCWWLPSWLDRRMPHLALD